MAVKPLPDIDTLHQLLRYEPETGKLFWRERSIEHFVTSDPRGAQWYCNSWNAKNAGKQSESGRSGSGHVFVKIFGQQYYAHRVAWAIYHRRQPIGQIDHIDGDPTNNRIDNLRCVSLHENQRNKARPSNNKSGVVGVSWHKQNSYWAAQISYRIQGKIVREFLGGFHSLEDAAAARKDAEKRLGFHENHGRSSVTPSKDAI